jgi:hypothetical protein
MWGGGLRAQCWRDWRPLGPLRNAVDLLIAWKICNNGDILNLIYIHFEPHCPMVMADSVVKTSKGNDRGEIFLCPPSQPSKMDLLKARAKAV